MSKKSKKNISTTYDRFIKSLSSEQRKKFEQEYKEFLISEMLLATMKEKHVSVQELAKLAWVSESIIQNENL